MKLLTRLRQSLCFHRHLVRERHDLDRAKNVLHFVCTACGHKQPAVERTAAEHRGVVKAGKPSASKAKRVNGPTPFRKAAQ